jgi:hypothetical protein
VIDPYGHLPILNLPANVELHYYNAPDLMDVACFQLLSNAGLNDSKLVVGFNIRYKAEPDGQGGLVSKSDDVDVIQIATGDTVYVFKVGQYDIFSDNTCLIVNTKVTQFNSALPPNLQAFIMTPTVIKAGISVRSDLLRIARRWKLSEFHKSLLSNSDPCYIELGQLAMLKGAVSSANVDLATLAGVVQRRRFVKHNGLSIADWSMLTLTDDHQIYAAQFAHAYLEIWSTLSREHSVGMPVEKGSWSA